jgi:hypothetical protein
MKPRVVVLMSARFVTFIFKHCFHYVFPSWLRSRIALALFAQNVEMVDDGIVQPLAMRLGLFGRNAVRSGSFGRSAVQLGAVPSN